MRPKVRLAHFGDAQPISQGTSAAAKRQPATGKKKTRQTELLIALAAI
jgi:hypothetical protein